VQVAVGTFNLNNLFSRFDFRADVSTASASTVKVEERTSFSFDDPSGFKLHTYLGKLVKGKLAAERGLIAKHIKRMDLDVLAVQEVEDIDTLRHFARDDLGGLYPHVVLIEGNDPRLIDIGLLSKLPLGGVTSWQHVPDPLHPGQPLFSRDLLQVEILSASGRERLFTLFNNHLKSHPRDHDERRCAVGPCAVRSRPLTGPTGDANRLSKLPPAVSSTRRCFFNVVGPHPAASQTSWPRMAECFEPDVLAQNGRVLRTRRLGPEWPSASNSPGLTLSSGRTQGVAMVRHSCASDE
jgi:hypothetical protein